MFSLKYQFQFGLVRPSIFFLSFHLAQTSLGFQIVSSWLKIIFFLSSRSFLAATIACARGWSSVGTCRGIAAYLVSISKKQRHSFPGTCLKGHKNKEKKHICTYRITQTFLCEFFFFLFLMADAFSHFYATLREAEPAANCSTNQVMMLNFVQRTDSRRDECLRLGHHWVMLCEC